MTTYLRRERDGEEAIRRFSRRLAHVPTASARRYGRVISREQQQVAPAPAGSLPAGAGVYDRPPFEDLTGSSYVYQFYLLASDPQSTRTPPQ